jgi:hypothetical protein
MASSGGLPIVAPDSVSRDPGARHDSRCGAIPLTFDRKPRSRSARVCPLSLLQILD